MMWPDFLIRFAQRVHFLIMQLILVFQVLPDVEQVATYIVMLNFVFSLLKRVAAITHFLQVPDDKLRFHFGRKTTVMCTRSILKCVPREESALCQQVREALVLPGRAADEAPVLDCIFT